MAKVPIKLEVDGKPEFDRIFHRLDARVKDLTPIWDDVRDQFWEFEKEQFASEGSAGRSGRWAALSKTYAERKRKMYGAKPILERTGRLRRSMIGQTGDTVYRANETEMHVGTNVPYSGFHQRGTSKMPARPPISFSGSQKHRMMKTIQRGLIREIRRGNVYIEEG